MALRAARLENLGSAPATVNRYKVTLFSIYRDGNQGDHNTLQNAMSVLNRNATAYEGHILSNLPL